MPDTPKVWSEQELINLFVRAGQVASSRREDVAKFLGMGDEAPQLFITKADAEVMIEQLVERALGRIGLPMATGVEQVETTYRLQRLFAFEADSRKFQKRLVWGVMTGIGTLIIAAITAVLARAGIALK